MRHIEEYKRLENDWLYSKGKAHKSSWTKRFSVKASEGFKDSIARTTGEGSECNVQGVGAQDCGSNRE